MENRRVHIRSFGCQMNKLDTALIGAALTDAGFALTDSVKDADVVLINTCSVRDHAEQRVLSHLGHLKHVKKAKPSLVVGVIGCMAQRLGDQLLEHEVVEVVCGPAQIPQLPDMVTETLARHVDRVAVTERIRQADARQDSWLDRFESTYGVEQRQIPGQAFVRVMRGCNNFCSYCIVPHVRGPEVCRPPQTILDQVRKLADEGVRQVTLLGQTVNSYHYRTDGRSYYLADLLRMVAEVDGIGWVKFVTSYPSNEFFEPILQAMAESSKVCNYLHMPAQSGSDRILRAMNRHYTAGQYLDLLETARSIVPGIAIAGDFIVGFPGETNQDFAATFDLVQRARYRNCFVFKYSPRPGTGADKRLADTVGDTIKQQRNTELLAVQEQISEQISRTFLGREVQVLVEGLSKKPHLDAAENPDHPQLVGRTSTDHIVVFNGSQSLAGRFANIRIIKTSPLTLFGELVE